MSPDLSQQIEEALARDDIQPQPRPMVEPPTVKGPSPTFEDRRRAFQAELERKRLLAEQMTPYHHYQAALGLRQHFAETFHHLTALKALPAMATPSLDDPWS